MTTEDAKQRVRVMKLKMVMTSRRKLRKNLCRSSGPGKNRDSVSR